MKNLILVFLILSLFLSACGEKGNESSADYSLIATSAESEASGESVTDVYITYANYGGRYLPELYEYSFKATLFSGEWENETAECVCDFKIKLIHEQKELEYSSQQGILMLDGKCKRLAEYDKENINKLLLSLFAIE